MISSLLVFNNWSSILLVFNNWSLLLLRLIVAIIFLVHGWPKIKNLKVNAENFSLMGFRPGWLWGSATALLETAGSLLLILGLGTQIVGLLIAIQMLIVVIWKKFKGQKFVDGYEFDLLLMVAGLILATSGGGELVIWF